MTITKKLTTASIAIASLFVGHYGYAVSQTGTAKQVVTTALALLNVSDLDFGTAAQGEAAKTVAPGSSENSENGSFAVTGQPNVAYTISLPSSAVTLTTGGGGANETISVDSFVSSPAATGLLDASGAQSLFVGATRAALTTSQVAGTYTGTYTVTVVY